MLRQLRFLIWTVYNSDPKGKYPWNDLAYWDETRRTPSFPFVYLHIRLTYFNRRLIKVQLCAYIHVFSTVSHKLLLKDLKLILKRRLQILQKLFTDRRFQYLRSIIERKKNTEHACLNLFVLLKMKDYTWKAVRSTFDFYSWAEMEFLDINKRLETLCYSQSLLLKRKKKRKLFSGFKNPCIYIPS